MKQNDINQLLNEHFSSKPGFDPKAAHEVAGALANASSVVAQHTGAKTVSSPTPKQQNCYAECQKTRDAALAAAAKLGFPFGIPAAAAAITAFNACRHQCDQNP